MAQNKTAVDAKAEQYYIDYFGEYGKLFVRKIPRTIKAAVNPKLRRTAAGKRDEVRVTDVVPLGYIVTASEDLHLDGVLKVANARDRLFHARFTSDGKLTKLQTKEVA